jgi:pimeloyl-ACP methyl ester carboxylesterase
MFRSLRCNRFGIPAANVSGSISAVENPLTSLADDAERTRKMVAQQKGPVLLVGHSYGGAMITSAGNQPNVAGLVYGLIDDAAKTFL